ncbi:MAG: hypothetical protein ACFFD4_35565 [Candidatus Odinarchaeota archaeon]
MSSYHPSDSQSSLRPIEEEIFEVLFDSCCEKGMNVRVEMKEIRDQVDDLTKAQLTNEHSSDTVITYQVVI